MFPNFHYLNFEKLNFSDFRGPSPFNFVQVEENTQFPWFFTLTLFQAGSGTYVTRRGEAIMARIDLSRHRFTQRPPTTLNLLPDKYFDLWLSIDTKNSPLCGILLRLRAVKWRWSKMKIFKRKKVKISNFGLQKCYIPQKKAENIYNKDSARKSKISCKKSNFFSIFRFFA